MTGAIPLTPRDLAVAAAAVVALAGLTLALRLRLARPLLLAAARTVVQLLLVGLALRAIFAAAGLGWILLMALVMLLAAGREVRARQGRPIRGLAGYAIGTAAMLVSSFTLTALALAAIIRADPWYAPQYAVPLLGMMLGNTMSGISLGLDRLTHGAWRERAVVEQRLMLGQTRAEAIGEIRREAARSGMMNIVNAMSAAGVVSLPGMMTGQILAGAPPISAVKYQILIMFLIAAGTGFGVVVALWFGSLRLFDARHRLRLDHLAAGDRT